MGGTGESGERKSLPFAIIVVGVELPFAFIVMLVLPLDSVVGSVFGATPSVG